VLDLQDAPQPDSSAPQQQHSALLHCLSQLNSDAWAQVLLPKLVEQGSAADAALTCSQLRDLCFDIRLKLDFGDLLAEKTPYYLTSCMHRVPAHLPNCTSVSLKISKDSSCHVLNYLMPTLERWVLVVQPPLLPLFLVPDVACTWVTSAGHEVMRTTLNGKGIARGHDEV
jgi:hypothetical protein